MTTAHVSDRNLKIWAFLLGTAFYTLVGYWLQVRHGFLLGDALSRVSAAQSVIFSRDPHLAAIGFIFTPLTAMLQIPFVALSPMWPPLTVYAFSGTLMSAAFMAGALVQIIGMGTDRGLPRAYVIAIAGVFALNPMIVFYASNGMSEAPFVFFLSWAVRRLVMWMVDDDVHHLVAAGGVAMALSYLTRYDAVGSIAAAGLLVGITTFRRATGAPRLHRAVLDLLMVSLPGFAAFLGWAAASWLITGDAFAQFSSQYGNSAILEQSGGGAASGLVSGFSFASVCTFLLAPTLVPIGVWAGINRWRRPDWQVLIVPVVMFGSVLIFQAYTYASGSTFAFLRFYIAAIPMTACLAMLAVPQGEYVPAKRRGRYAKAPSDPAATTKAPRRVVAYVPVVLAFAVSLPVTAYGMSMPKYAPQEYALAAVLAPKPDSINPVRAEEAKIAATFSTERQIARYLDSLGLPEGSVITDTVYGFAILSASARPRTFIVPSDPDFVRILNNPSDNHIRYLLAVPKAGRGVSDALNQRYPTLYDTGGGIATLELEVPNNGANQPVWRIYRVLDAVSRRPE